MNQLVKPGRKLARQQLVVSLLVTLSLSLVMYFYWGFSYAQSALAGGVICIIPNVVFAYKAFKYAGASSSEKVMDSFYSGEKLKLGLTAFLFALAFKFLVIVPVPLFVTYFVVVISSLLTSILFKL